MALAHWARAGTDHSGWVGPRLILLMWTGMLSPLWVLKGLQSPALSGSVFTLSSWGSPWSLPGMLYALLPHPSAAMYRGVCPRLSHPSSPPLLCSQDGSTPSPWLPPALSLTTFPFSESLLSHFLPRAQSSVNIFECINLALLHKGNLPMCVIRVTHQPVLTAGVPCSEAPSWASSLLFSPCLPPLGEVQGAVVRDGNEESLRKQQRPVQM